MQELQLQVLLQVRFLKLGCGIVTQQGGAAARPPLTPSVQVPRRPAPQCRWTSQRRCCRRAARSPSSTCLPAPSATRASAACLPAWCAPPASLCWRVVCVFQCPAVSSCRRGARLSVPRRLFVCRMVCALQRPAVSAAPARTAKRHCRRWSEFSACSSLPLCKAGGGFARHISRLMCLPPGSICCMGSCLCSACCQQQRTRA